MHRILLKCSKIQYQIENYCRHHYLNVLFPGQNQPAGTCNMGCEVWYGKWFSDGSKFKTGSLDPEISRVSAGCERCWRWETCEKDAWWFNADGLMMDMFCCLVTSLLSSSISACRRYCSETWELESWRLLASHFTCSSTLTANMSTSNFANVYTAPIGFLSFRLKTNSGLILLL